MVAASASRIGLGLSFAPFVVVALSGSAASQVFQLLLLQGGLIALLSASAYARGAHLEAGEAPVGPAARSFLRFLLLAAAAAILTGAALLPIRGEGEAVRLGVLVVLVVGSASSALTGFLQGVIAVRDGGLVAFLPSLVVSTLGIVGILALWGPQPMLVVVTAWGLPQVLNSLVLLSAVPSARRVLCRTSSGDAPGHNMFAATGLVNAGSVGVGYVFRERWAAAFPASGAELGFFVVRVTELIYQVFYMAAASLPRRVNGVVASRLASSWRRAQLILIGLMCGLSMVTPALVWSAWSLKHLVIAELAAAPGRLLTTVCWLYLLGRSTTRGYQTAVLGGTMLGVAGMALAPIQTSPYGLQAFHLANLVSAVLVVLSADRRVRAS